MADRRLADSENLGDEAEWWASLSPEEFAEFRIGYPQPFSIVVGEEADGRRRHSEETERDLPVSPHEGEPST